MTTTPENETLPPIFNLITDSFTRDPYPTFAALRHGDGAVQVLDNGVRMWLVTRYEDARRLLADPLLSKDLMSVRKQIAHCLVRPEPDQHARVPRMVRRSMLEQEGANHRRLRSMLAHLFTRRRAVELRSAAERTADALLDALPAGEPVDLVDGYTRPFGVNVLSDLFGVPPGFRNEFSDWQNDLLSEHDSAEEKTDGGRKMFELCLEMIELKRREPQEDVFTELVVMEREGVLDFEELVATFFLLFFGAVEPIHSASNGLLALITHPDQLTKVLTNPELWSKCVDEVLRYDSSFRTLPPRHCPVPVELDDITIPAHELILVANSSANRDPAKFRDPDTFDVTRDAQGHLAFGHGTHKCLGASMGKMEVEVALRRLFERFPRTTLTVPADQLRWWPGTFIRRLKSLPAVLA